MKRVSKIITHKKMIIMRVPSDKNLKFRRGGQVQTDEII